MKSTIFKTISALGILFATKIYCCDLWNTCNKGFKSTGNLLLTIKDIGVNRCGKTCASIGGCRAFSFEQNKLMCTLSDSTDLVASSDGWRHCTDLQCVKERMGACANKSLSPGAQCFELSSGQAKIIFSLCMETPTVSNGTVTIKDRTVGSRALLSCLPNYISIGNPYLTCKHDGTWTDMTFSCKDCGPPPTMENMTMSGSGDSWLVGSKIEYKCYAGMGAQGATSVTCLKDGTWSNISALCIPFDWPQGKFTLLQPVSGCPTHFASGFIDFPMEANSATSEINHVKGSVTNTSVLWYFCTNTVVSHVVSWPKGDYCILHAGVCPTGFNGIHQHIRITRTSTVEGTVLRHSRRATETIIYLCCRSDGNVNTPIDLPTTHSFFLFRNVAFSCQVVNGMTSNLEDTLFDDKVPKTGRTHYHNDNTGLVHFNRSTFTIQLFYCYYAPSE